MQKRISCFPPVIGSDPKVLLLGSVPGVQSLEKQQYYAHPRNSFWPIMFELLGEPFSTDYEDRVNLIRRNRIALWDCIASCERQGSLDSEIKNEEASKILELLSDHPTIQAVYCNGQKSYTNILKLLGKDFRLPIFALASTSPAYAGMKYEAKLQSWAEIKKYL